MDLENANIPHIYGCRNSCMLGISLNLDFNMLSNFRYYEKKRYVIRFSFALAHRLDATLLYQIFSCSCVWKYQIFYCICTLICRYVIKSSLAVGVRISVGLHTSLMLRCQIFSGTCTPN